LIGHSPKESMEMPSVKWLTRAGGWGGSRVNARLSLRLSLTPGIPILSFSFVADRVISSTDWLVVNLCLMTSLFIYLTSQLLLEANEEIILLRFMTCSKYAPVYIRRTI
jgi:hypothetical protein